MSLFIISFVKRVQLGITGFMLSILLGGAIASAQELTNLSAMQRAENDIEITYQLNGPAGKAFTVALFASHNNYASQLQNVEGDAGRKRVLPGTNKSIHWRALDELKNFEGDIAFEIRAVVAAPLFTKVGASAAKVKRGKDVIISWQGGLNTEPGVVELVKKDKHTQIGNIANNGKLIYSVPKKMKTGNYAIQLTQAGEWTSGSSFMVRPKTSWVMKVLPFVVTGAVIALWPRPVEEFPEPPDLTK